MQTLRHEHRLEAPARGPSAGHSSDGDACSGLNCNIKTDREMGRSALPRHKLMVVETTGESDRRVFLDERACARGLQVACASRRHDRPSAQKQQQVPGWLL